MAAGHPQYLQDQCLFDLVKENPDFKCFLKALIQSCKSVGTGALSVEHEEQAKAYYRRI